MDVICAPAATGHNQQYVRPSTELL